MSYSAKAVANFFLERAEEARSPVSPMKLQKLVFFAHGWHLGIEGEPLISETIEAWKFGPVIRSLFDEFRDFGSSPITRKALKYKMVGEEIQTKTPVVPHDDHSTRAFLSRIWDVYHKYTAIQLSNLTHAAGTPWALTVKPHNGDPPLGLDIPDETIKRHFKELASSNG